MVKLSNIIIFVLFLLSNINAITIKDTYFFTKHTIYANDIVDDIPASFKVFDIPKNTSTLQVRFLKIQNIFLKNGFNIKTNKKRYITFKKKMTFDEQKLKKYIKNKYTKKYPSIEIVDISIQSFSYINIDNYKIASMQISKSHLNSDTGSIKVHFIESITSKTNHINKKNIFFKYNINAFLPALKAVKFINRGSLLTVKNTKITKASISIYNKSLHSLQRNTFYAKNNIKTNTYVKSTSIKRKYLIVRNSTIIVMYKIDFIQAQRNAKAMQSGYLNDWIDVKIDNKIQKVKIIGENRAEIL